MQKILRLIARLIVARHECTYVRLCKENAPIYMYYVAPEAPMMSSVIADCPDLAPPNILDKSTPMTKIYIHSCIHEFTRRSATGNRIQYTQYILYIIYRRTCPRSLAWRLEWDSNRRRSDLKASNQPMCHHDPRILIGNCKKKLLNDSVRLQHNLCFMNSASS